MKGKTRMHAEKVLLAAATLLLAALLILTCADIYLTGNAPSNRTEAGVLMEPVFSRDIAAERLGKISWAVILWIVSLAAAVTGCIVRPAEARGGSGRGRARRMEPLPEQGRRTGRLRAALYALAALLIAAGILNGGMRDVLVKAINICTECIGLG